MQLPSLTQLAWAIIAFFCATSAFSQSSPIAQNVHEAFHYNSSIAEAIPFTVLHERNQAALNVAPKAQFLTVNLHDLAEINQNRPQLLRLKLPFHGEMLELELVRTEVTTADFSVITEQTNSPQPYKGGVHYRGILRGSDTELAAISFFEDEVMGGIYTSNKGNLVLGRLAEQGNQEQYILYSDQEMAVENPFSCATEATDPDPDPDPDPKGGGHTSEVNKCIRVFMEADNELFIDKGSSIQATVNYLLGMFNQTATLYANEQINTISSQIFVWTTPDIYTPTSSAVVLDQFRNFRSQFNGDLAHLVGLGGSNLGGIAYVDVLCSSSYNVAFSDIATTFSNVPVYSWTVEVFTHEMGHNLGSRHTQWCGWQGGAIDNCVPVEGNCAPGPAPTNGGTIMSYCHLAGYGINFNNGFGPQPGNTIRTETTGAACLAAACPTAACDAPINLSVTSIIGSGATIGWAATNGATGYILRYRLVGGQWTTINTPSNPYVITGLAANKDVEVTVQALCGSNSSDYRNGILFRTGASGGSGGGGTTCNVPSNLITTPAATTAAANWSAVTGASGYTVQWKTVASATWSSPATASTNNFNITGLTASTNYNLRVSTNCNGSTSSFATTNFTTTAGGGGTTCNPPTNLAATPTASSATINWSAVSGATGYGLEWKLTSGSTWSTPVNLTANTHNITGLTASTAYDVRIRTTCTGGNSTYATANFTTSASGGGGGGSCGAVQPITALPSTSGAALTWGVVTGATSYSVEWKLASATAWSTPVTASSTNYSITGLNSNSSYQFRIGATCPSGTSAKTNSVFTTASASNTCTGVPTGLVATATASGANVTWTAMTNATSYRIQWRAATATTWSTLTSTTTPSYTINNLQANTAYIVRVASRCATSTSAYSVTTFVTGTGGGNGGGNGGGGGGTACTTPTNLSVGNPSPTGGQCNWTGVTGANGYTVQWKTTTSSTWNTVVNVTSTSYTLLGLTSATAYNVRVATVCTSGNSTYITTTFTTAPNPSGCLAPLSISSTPSDSSAKISWPAVAGATSYQIQWQNEAAMSWTPLLTVNTNGFNITGLAENANYNVRVRTVCTGIGSNYTSGSFFTAPSGGVNYCDKPSGLSTTVLLPTFATIIWSPVNYGISYNMKIRAAGSPNWFFFGGLPSPQVSVQNLTPATTYEMQLEANCGNNGSSGYAPTFQFTTPANLTEGEVNQLGEGTIVKLPVGNGVVVANLVPNPTSSDTRIFLDAEDAPIQITISNSMGQIVGEQFSALRGGSAELATHQLSNGIYFVRVQTSNSLLVTLRLVKQ